MNLLETIIDKFDGVIIEDNQWTMEGSNGNMVWINNIRTNTLKSKYREWNCTINNGWIRSGGDILDEVWWRSKEQRNWFINWQY